ncbi:MAG: hypothetical protein ACR2HF_08000, partial [Methylococcaceae bacterium]
TRCQGSAILTLYCRTAWAVAVERGFSEQSACTGEWQTQGVPATLWAEGVYRGISYKNVGN